MEEFFSALKARREASSSAGSGGETFLLVGLGNPGREYRETRHNFGFMVADRICERVGVTADKAQLKAITATATISGRHVENAGFGGRWAAPIAGLMIEQYLNDSVSNKAMETYVLNVAPATTDRKSVV